MPLTRFQIEVLRVLAGGRSPDSYVAGGTVINAAATAPRFSGDVDVFHDAAASVARSVAADAQTLFANGFTVTWQLRLEAFARALVQRDGEACKLEWTADSAFRFFPTEPDPTCGWRLHPLDAATNKILALVGRREPRDYVDAVYLHRTQLSFGALCWAAAGKDAGFTPAMLVELAARSTHYRQEEIDALYLATPVDALALKAQWLVALEQARELVTRLPAADVGCLYLDASGRAVTPGPEFAGLVRHFGCVGGAWPIGHPMASAR